jgi:MFS family permease
MRPSAAVGLAGIASFYTAATSSMVNVSLYAMRIDLHASPRAIGLVVSAHLAVVCALLLPAGRVVDRLGPTRAIPAGAGIAALASLGCVFAPSLETLVLLRVLMAVGSALLMASGPSLVVAHVPPERRGRGLGVQAAMTYVGLVVGPAAGGAMAAWSSWRGIFAASAAIALALGIAPAWLDRETPITVRRAGGVGLWIVPGLIAAALHYAAAIVLSTALPLRLGAEGRSPAAVGALFTLVAIAMAGAAPVSGALVDRAGARLPATASLLVACASLLAILWDAPRIPWLLAFGAGAGMFATANTTGVMGSAPPDARGAAASWLALARNAGMAAGSIIGTGAPYPHAIAAAAGAAAAGAMFAFWASSRRDLGPS